MLLEALLIKDSAYFINGLSFIVEINKIHLISIKIFIGYTHIV